MLIAVRVDSSSLIGSGHLMRCLTLADYLKTQGHEVRFISRELEGAMHFEVEKRGYGVYILPAPFEEITLFGYQAWLGVPQEKDAQDTISIIQDIGNVGLLIVDSYAIDKNWEKELRPFVKKIFVIDDIGNRTHDCDFLLDQTYGVENTNKYEGLIPSRCTQFLGSAYCLLKPEYRKLRQKIDLVRTTIENILIFYGGSDDTGETIKVLEAVKKDKFRQYQFIVIVGSSNLQKDIVQKYCNEIDNVEFHCQVDNMEHYISISDIAFASAGVNTWERCVLGLPSIITVTADNQQEIAEKMCEKNASVILGSYEKITCEDYDRSLNDLMSLDVISLSKNAAALMEKDGMYELLKVTGENI